MNVGFVCGAFDLLHAGHIQIFKEAKKRCEFLLVGLHVNPNSERLDKNKPIESVLERQIKLNTCKFIDDVIVYENEEDIPKIIEYFGVQIRFLGEDYLDKKKSITAKGAAPIVYLHSLPIHTSDIRREIVRRDKQRKSKR